MTLDQLRVFVAVAEHAHVTRAAAALGLTQSAASAAIAALEARYGVRLFDRIGRRIGLTESGRGFLPEARAVLERAEAARAALEQAAGPETGSVAIWASQTIANHWLPRRLAAFHADYPRVRLDLSIANSRAVAAAVAEGAADLGLIEGPVEDIALTRRAVGRDRPLLVVAAGAEIPALADGRPDVRALGWVVREAGSGTRALLEAYAAASGVALPELRVVLTLPSNEAVREAVEAGAGATVISEHVVRRAIAAGTLRAAAIDLRPRDFVLVHLSGRRLSPAQNALLRRLGGI